MSQKLKAGIIFALACLVYIPALKAGFFWDDAKWLADHSLFGAREGLVTFWTNPRFFQEYCPLVPSSFWFEHLFWHFNPMGYHLDNILLHATNAVLVYVFLSVLQIPGAWLAGIIFAVHPVHVESVVWITERKNVLSCMFYLMAMISYLRFANVGLFEEAETRKKWLFYFAAIFLFLFATLSKAVTLTFPATTLMLLWWNKGNLKIRDIFLMTPFFLISAAIAYLTLFTETHYAAAEGYEFAWSILERLLIAGKAFWFYFGKLVWPVDLTLVYPKWKIDVFQVKQYFYPLAAIAFIAGLSLPRSKLRLTPFVNLMFFSITLVPTLGFFNVAFFRFAYVADHWQYHASIGPIALFSMTASRIVGCPKILNLFRWSLGLITSILIVVLSALSWHRVTLFQDNELLWRDAVRKNPDSAITYYNLGVELQGRGQSDAASDQYRKAIQIKPNYLEARNNYAVILTSQGKLEEATDQLTQALEINPDFGLAHGNLGIVLAKQEKLDDAIQHFKEAVRITPDNIQGYYNLEIAMSKKSTQK